MTKSAWKCSVCGYVHYGDNPPESCPVCGATSDLFEVFEETLAIAPVTSINVSQWRCLNCEYIHDGTAPPESCPVCGSPADSFEPNTPESPAVITGENRKLRIVIAGAGIAGVSAAESVRKSLPDAQITLISKEAHLPYYRLNLTRYLAGEISVDTLPLHGESWYKSQSITLHSNKAIHSIDATGRKVILTGDETLEFDKLIYTIGSHPFIPAIAGAHRENVTALRTKDDADFILNRCKSKTQVVVIGGGILGLETAGALAQMGSDVSLLEGSGWLLPRQLNEDSGLMLELFAASKGIKLLKNARTKEIVGDDCVRGILLDDGRTIPAQLVVIATGVRPNSYLARLAGLNVNQGVVVDNYLKSSHPDIFAAGDACEHQGMSYGTWGPSQFQGTIAGINAAGGNSQFMGIARSNMLKVLGIDMFSIGQISGPDASFRAVASTRDNAYYHFLFRDNLMVGAILLGKIELSTQIKTVVEKRVDCSSLLIKSLETDAVLDFLRAR